jgi:predicted nuclease of predicted toxin-antitoxin system
VRFLSDQDVYALTIRFLRALDHDVITAAELGLSRAPDTELLNRAAQGGRIFVTRDKDFGALVFAQQLGKGVILLRVAPSTLDASHRQLKLVLERHQESDLGRAFVVIEPGRHRVRWLENK